MVVRLVVRRLGYFLALIFLLLNPQRPFDSAQGDGCGVPVPMCRFSTALEAATKGHPTRMKRWHVRARAAHRKEAHLAGVVPNPSASGTRFGCGTDSGWLGHALQGWY